MKRPAPISVLARAESEAQYQEWLYDVRRIVTRSLAWHYPNFGAWRTWYEAGNSPQLASDRFLHMIATIPE
jgi:hypothetical protein